MILATSTNMQRRGATAVEYAVIAPLAFLLIFGVIVGGVGVFRYQQVAALAREGARYASVRGIDYSGETKLPAATQDSIYKECILDRAVGMEKSALSCKVFWDKYNAAQTIDADGKPSGNIVIVTVSYKWVPEAFLGGMTLSSTSKLPMTH